MHDHFLIICTLSRRITVAHRYARQKEVALSAMCHISLVKEVLVRRLMGFLVVLFALLAIRIGVDSTTMRTIDDKLVATAPTADAQYTIPSSPVTFTIYTFVEDRPAIAARSSPADSGKSIII